MLAVTIYLVATASESQELSYAVLIALGAALTGGVALLFGAWRWVGEAAQDALLLGWVLFGIASVVGWTFGPLLAPALLLTAPAVGSSSRRSLRR